MRIFEFTHNTSPPWMPLFFSLTRLSVALLYLVESNFMGLSRGLRKKKIVVAIFILVTIFVQLLIGVLLVAENDIVQNGLGVTPKLS